MTKAWPVVSLAHVIRYRKEFVSIDDMKYYKRCRVQLRAQGIVLRDVVPGAEIKTKQQQVCHTGEFLVAEIDAKVGGFGIVPESLDGAIVSSHYFLFQIDDERLDRTFLDFFIRTPAFYNQVSAQGSTNYAAIRPNDVLGYKIPLPMLEEQRRIASRIEKLATKIEGVRLLRQQAGRAEELWQGSLARAFRPTGKLIVSLEDACEAIIDNLHSTPEYDGDEFPCIRSQDIGWGTISYSAALRTCKHEFLYRTRRGEPRAGDIVYVREGDIGRCAVVDGSKRFCLGQRVMMFRPDVRRIDSRFLALQLMSPPVLRDQILVGKAGTTSHHVNIKRLRRVSICVPDLTEQRRVVTYLEHLREKIDRLSGLQAETGLEIDALLLSVLDKAFKGGL